MRPGKTRKKIPAFAFVVDGHTEIWYLQMFKRNEEKFNNLRINIKPEIPQKKKLEDQVELLLEQAKSEYDKVFWIVDLDVVLKETRESKSDNTSLKKLLSFLDELENPKSKKDEEKLLLMRVHWENLIRSILKKEYVKWINFFFVMN